MTAATLPYTRFLPSVPRVLSSLRMADSSTNCHRNADFVGVAEVAGVNLLYRGCILKYSAYSIVCYVVRSFFSVFFLPVLFPSATSAKSEKPLQHRAFSVLNVAEVALLPSFCHFCHSAATSTKKRAPGAVNSERMNSWQKVAVVGRRLAEVNLLPFISDPCPTICHNPFLV